MPQNEFSSTLNNINKQYFGTTAPSSGDYVKGDILLNSAPSAGGATGWICVSSGTPGTWSTIGSANSVSLSTVTSASVLTAGSGTVLINGTGPFTLAQAVSHAAGFKQTIKNINATQATIVTVAGATYEAAAITLAQYGSVALVSDGVSAWHKSANGADLSGTFATIAAAAVLSSAKQNILINGTGPFTLAQAAPHSSGYVQRVKNLNATTLTIVTVAGALHDAAAITLAQYASVTLVSDGSTTWHKMD